MRQIRCAACAQPFTPKRHVPGQRFCAKPACQRERRRRWQRQKRKDDADYRANQAAAQKRWRANHPDYWRQYRQTHPDYTARNREQQQQRNRRRAAAPSGDQAATGLTLPTVAKMDAYPSQNPVVSGTYRLVPVAGSGIAKMDVYTVEMRVISAP
ncbi:MAG: hypothetical protein PVF93_10190 [Chromatiaceae bacterium]|jgi:hypothetical protein